jgi:uncharacterized protein
MPTSLDRSRTRLAADLARDARPRLKAAHWAEGDGEAQLLVVNGSRLYRIPEGSAPPFRLAFEEADEAGLQQLLQDYGLQSAPYIDDTPLAPPPAHALSLAVAQKCNLGCTYCYAGQGEFGGRATNMDAAVAHRAVDWLIDQAEPGGRVNLAFMGGEPLANRAVLHSATRHALNRAQARGLRCGFSVTTNGTLLTPEDTDFFEAHGFAVTVSLDGAPEQHDRLRSFKGGKGSFEHIVERLAPLLLGQRKMQVSCRVTVTPFNLDLPRILDRFIDMGFHSVGFSPLLRASNGQAEMTHADLMDMLQAMVECGQAFEQAVVQGRRYPFLNMVNALRELQRGSHRPYPCGAGAGYFGVSAQGELSACHRFVGDEAGAMGSIEGGIATERQVTWLAERHVHQQSPCQDCWARYLCGGGCHHEVLARGRGACDYIRGWLHYVMGAHRRLSQTAPEWYAGPHD